MPPSGGAKDLRLPDTGQGIDILPDLKGGEDVNVTTASSPMMIFRVIDQQFFSMRSDPS